jgi:predicted transcriptional regulator
MAATTTIRLPPKLRARVAQLARESGRSAHSFIIEAVERHAEHEARMRELVKEAREADAAIERTGQVYPAADVHACMQRLAKDGAAPRPKPWRR